MRVALLGLVCAMSITLDAGIASGRSFWSNSAFDSTDAIGLGVVAGRVWTGLHAFDGAAGVGVQLLMEHRFAERYRWDLRLGGFSAHINAPTEVAYPADNGDCAVVSTGIHRDLRRSGFATWWAGGEVSLHYYQMKQFAYDAGGFGIGPSLGVDVRSPTSSLFTRIGAHLSWVDLTSRPEDPSHGAFVALLGVDVLYRFGRPRQPRRAWPFDD
jgi:hypothetical protein